MMKEFCLVCKLREDKEMGVFFWRLISYCNLCDINTHKQNFITLEKVSEINL